jgi:hypothetical protein
VAPENPLALPCFLELQPLALDWRHLASPAKPWHTKLINTVNRLFTGSG